MKREKDFTFDDQLKDTLLLAATSLGEVLDIKIVVERLREILSSVPGLHQGGLGVYDIERKTVTLYSFKPTQAAGTKSNDDPIEVREEAGADAGIHYVDHPPELYLSPDLVSLRTLPLQDHLFECGVRRYANATLMVENQLLGSVYIGFADSTSLQQEVVEFLKRLAKILSPILWNCEKHIRFSHGDVRRDALIRLGDAINQSLKIDTILSSARSAIKTLSGHVLSSINLLVKNGESFLSYVDITGPTEKKPGAETVNVAGTVLEWIQKNRATYESEDLEKQTAFDHDTWLASRGVRRYVAAPMFVRGRIIGCFLMGCADPRKTLHIDIWLYENIALQLALAIDNASQLEEVQRLSSRLAQQNVYLREEIESEHNFTAMVGETPEMRAIQETVRRVAPTNSTVLILGETGVGKELVARAIHEASDRSASPMVKVNCAAIPEGMVESELFGHEKGAFTSAIQRRIGRFELAHEGTIFLDEVGELPLAVQSKLLRVLQDMQFERVGGTKTLTTDVRIIAATNRNLQKSSEQGTFRSDLYYRLNVFPITVPPLRDRAGDVPLLIEAFISHFNRQMGKRVESISPESLELCLRKDWPGNVRELRHEIERAMILCDGTTLTLRLDQYQSTQSAVPPTITTSDKLMTLSEAEAEHIRRALAHTNGVIEGPGGAAALLDINPSTLRFRMKRLGIRRDNSNP